MYQHYYSKVTTPKKNSYQSSYFNKKNFIKLLTLKILLKLLLRKKDFTCTRFNFQKNLFPSRRKFIVEEYNGRNDTACCLTFDSPAT